MSKIDENYHKIDRKVLVKMGSKQWTKGLVEVINNPQLRFISSDVGVVIKDKYAKATYHFLVLPYADIESVFNLKKEHIKLLYELKFLGINAIEVIKKKEEEFKIGFHAEPSMQRLHLHVISKDFVSPYLKTKKHWNSFNTKLFIPFNDMIKIIETNDSFRRLEPEVIRSLKNTELKCNQCRYVSQNIPTLKSHLLTHVR